MPRPSYGFSLRAAVVVAGLLLLPGSRVFGLEPAALDKLVALAPADRAHAIQAEALLRAPVLSLTASPVGLLVVELGGVRCLDAWGRPRWRCPVPSGVLRWAIPRSGRWVAIHTSRISASGERKVEDWLIDARTGRSRVLSSESHPSARGPTDRQLIAWDPLPFQGIAEDDDSAPPTPPLVPIPTTNAPRLGYRRRDLPRHFLLEEGLLVLRSSTFHKKRKSWWSLHHYSPESGQGTKLGDGTPGLTAADLRATRRHAEVPDALQLKWRGRPAVLDLVQGTLTRVPRLPHDRQDREESPTLTVAEVYHFETRPGEGVSLVHPGGRMPLALTGRRIVELARLPGSPVLFALEESHKVSLIRSDSRRTLHRIDLGNVGENLTLHNRIRNYQTQLNQALELSPQLADPSLWLSEKTYARILALLPDPAPSPELTEQRNRLLRRAKVDLASRFEAAKRVAGVRGLLRPPDSPEAAAALLGFDLRLDRTALEADVAYILEREELWRDQPAVHLELAREALYRRDSEAASRWLASATESRDDAPKGAAAVAVALGDRHLAAEAGPKAIAAYRLARRLKPTSEGALRKLARALEQNGQPCQASRALRSAANLDRDGTPGGIRSTAFDAALECGDHALARALIDSLRVDQPLEPSYLEQDADLLVLEGKPKDAVPKYRAILRLQPAAPGLAEKLAAAEAAARNP